MDWLKEVNKRLAETRDQKFRSQSQKKIDGINSQKANLENKFADSEYRKKWSNANKTRWEDKEWADKQKEKLRLSRLDTDEERIASTVSDPEWQKKYGIGNRWKDPEFRAKMIKANSKPQTPEQRRANIIRSGGQPFTCPWGAFDTPQAASDASLELTGTFRSRKWVSLRVKKKVKQSEGFEHISWEEYDKRLTFDSKSV